MNLRASDDDAETREAHAGLVSPTALLADLPTSLAPAGDELDPESAAAHAAQQPPPYLQPPPPAGDGSVTR